jgi:hypothetical protein
MRLHSGFMPVTPSGGEELLLQRGLKTNALFIFGLLGLKAPWASLFTIVINNICN